MNDKASKLAYKIATSTFNTRKNLIGNPIFINGGFAGLIDMGDYYIIQCCDGIGTKMLLYHIMNRYNIAGQDLLAMVSDDIVCMGGEVISITNTIDTNMITINLIEKLMKGLSRACIEQKIVISGGEIAILKHQATSLIWNASAIGIVKKNNVITGYDIKEGDKIIALEEKGFRSNGYSLILKIIKEYYYNIDLSTILNKTINNSTYGDELLLPSKIYHRAILQLIYSGIKINGIAHITGGGIPHNISRILPTGLGAELNNLYPLTSFMKHIQTIGNISDKEAYKNWNMGNGMLLICSECDNIIEILSNFNINSRICGSITSNNKIKIYSNDNIIEYFR